MQLPPAATREQKEAKHAVKIIQRGGKAGAVSSIATRGSVIKEPVFSQRGTISELANLVPSE